MATITALASLPEHEGTLTRNNLDGLNANVAAQNVNNTNINADIASLVASLALAALAKPAITAISASGSISPHASSTNVVTKSSAAAALTLAAPTATTDDGVIITITSNTPKAHTITATGLLQTGDTPVNVATFAAVAGASITLIAYQGKWNVLSSNQVTFS